jgi:hypothetical protein
VSGDQICIAPNIPLESAMNSLPRTWLKSSLVVLVTATATALPAVASAACDVRSGPRTTALIELYTSEGCSSCPPADRALKNLRQTLDPAADAVPLALHVGYWDELGWKDPFAQAAFAERQRWLVHLNQHRTVYTPHFFVNGGELRGWQSGLRDQVRALNAAPAAADLHLQSRVSPAGALNLQIDAATRPAATADSGSLALYVAVTEDGLQSVVARGENGGVTLSHDHVVRQWLGPFPLQAGMARTQTELALPPTWKRSQLAALAFVEDQRTGQVLQAVSTAQCGGL